MITRVATKVFGSVVEEYEAYFDSLREKLKQSGMKYNVVEYVSLLLLASLISFVVVILLGSFFMAVATAYAAYSYTFSIVISLLFSSSIFATGYYIPTIKAKSIENKISKQLPFIVVYMSSAASANVPAEYIFRMASLRKGIIAEECKRIYRDVRLLGMNIETAISKAASRTPSSKFSELLWGMLSVITRGGNLWEYLDEKAREMMTRYRRSLGDYSKKVSFYTEIYITLVIVGTLFFIVLSTIMGPLVGGDILFVQTFLVFFFIPLISAGFLVILRGLSPSE